MPLAFDPGYTRDPFQTLCDQAPDASVYPYSSFRMEWGPIWILSDAEDSCGTIQPASMEVISSQSYFDRYGSARLLTEGLLVRIEPGEPTPSSDNSLLFGLAPILPVCCLNLCPGSLPITPRN